MYQIMRAKWTSWAGTYLGALLDNFLEIISFQPVRKIARY